MEQFIEISFDLFLEKGHKPRYRLFVNNELFTERTYIWTDNWYVKEHLQVYAKPGEYKIELVKLDPAKYSMRNTKIEKGKGEVLKNDYFRIY